MRTWLLVLSVSILMPAMAARAAGRKAPARPEPGAPLDLDESKFRDILSWKKAGARKVKEKVGLEEEEERVPAPKKSDIRRALEDARSQLAALDFRQACSRAKDGLSACRYFAGDAQALVRRAELELLQAAAERLQARREAQEAFAGFKLRARITGVVVGARRGFVHIGGRVLSAGDEFRPVRGGDALRIEAVENGAVVFRFRGYRFRVDLHG